jgi:tRNA (guanine37-N1)-methyltransferase
MTHFHVITLFPESLGSYLGASILKRAEEKGLIKVSYYNPRDYVTENSTPESAKDLTYSEKRVDNKPYGGGPGMVIEALPVIRAIDSAVGAKIRDPKTKRKVKIVFFSPHGKQFTNSMAETYKKFTDIVFVCGRYEGIDARVKKAFPMTEVSVGPFVLTGGELPAMIMIDSVTRRIPGVLGDDSSIEESRVAGPDVYTRPEIIEFGGKKLRVPKILLSGHHAKIDEWKEGLKKGGIK